MQVLNYSQSSLFIGSATAQNSAPLKYRGLPYAMSSDITVHPNGIQGAYRGQRLLFMSPAIQPARIDARSLKYRGIAYSLT